MREIKFRAWDKPIKRWYSPVYEAYKGRLEELNIGMSGRLNLRTMEGSADESTFEDRFDIMQYTGLKDKSGVEIYEGDILQTPYDIFKVDDILPLRKDFWHTDDSDWWSYPEEVEVIGNIYENPDLLKDSV